MNGVHDMGGMDGFGKVEPEPNEPVFHARWEGRVLAMQRAMGYAGAWHIDHGRFALETAAAAASISRPPITSDGRWPGEEPARARLRRARTRSPPAMRCDRGKALKRKLTPTSVPASMTRGSFFRQQQGPARFKPGDRVRTKNINPPTHTRLPRYARGKVGMVELIHGCHVYPGFGRDRSGRRSAMALHGRVRRPRDLGRGRRPDPEGLDRCLRAVSRAGVMPSSIRQPRSTSRQPFPSIPRDAEGPVFREPWEAQAFAMALALHERGLFTWPEWAATLGDEIKRAQAAGDPDTGETYYRHWLAALERLVAEKGIADADDPGALPRRLGPRRRPHAARHADRAAAGRFQVGHHVPTGDLSPAERAAKVRRLRHGYDDISDAVIPPLRARHCVAISLKSGALSDPIAMRRRHPSAPCPPPFRRS